MFLFKINLREVKLYRLIKYPRCCVQSNISLISIKKMRFSIFLNLPDRQRSGRRPNPGQIVLLFIGHNKYWRLMVTEEILRLQLGSTCCCNGWLIRTLLRQMTQLNVFLAAEWIWTNVGKREGANLEKKLEKIHRKYVFGQNQNAKLNI